MSSNASKLPSRLHYFTKKYFTFINSINLRLSTVKYSSNNIFDIIQKLAPNKGHSHDMVSIRMLKISGKSICRPLELISNECISNGVFPSEWKKGGAKCLFTRKMAMFRKLPSCLFANNL